MGNVLRRLVARLPRGPREELIRLRMRRLVAHPPSLDFEPELDRLGEWLSPGDWAVDVGANVGLYTARMSAAVGPSGRVVALEPVPSTFALLAANTRVMPHENVTLHNAAATDAAGVVGMRVPRSAAGLEDHYQSHLCDDGADVRVVGVRLDDLPLPHPVALVKVDAEGHELAVLRGMRRLLERDRPALVVEASDAEGALAFLAPLGYRMRALPGSANRIFEAA